MTTIVVPDDYPPTYGSPDQADLRRLGPYGEVIVFSTRWGDRADLYSRLANADVAINVRAYTTFDEDLFAQAPRLRMISVQGTGTDNVDLAAARARGIVVTNTPGVGAPSVAELTFGLLLAVARAIPTSDAALRRGGWQHVDGPELDGKTLGVLGLGAIGSRVARIGQGFGMRIVGFSFLNDPERAARLGIELVDRDDLFRQADVVSIHLRNLPELRGLVGRRELGLMKPTAILLNTARAALVDQDALVDALNAGRLAGAGLDVYLEEPLPPERNPFKDMTNVVLTPHLGSVTRESGERSRARPVDNVIAFLEGRPQNVVNP